MKTYLSDQNGNAIWFILLTVALLGFLTAVISRSTSSVDQTGGVERARITASTLLQYSKSIHTAVETMMLGGVSENDLDFVAISAAHNNTNCTVTACEVFDTEGGGIPYRSAANIIRQNSFANDWFVSTGNRIGLMGCDTASNACRDLTLLLKGITDETCLQINKLMNITNPSDAPPQQEEVEEGTAFTGSYSVNADNELLGGSNAVNESPQVEAKEAGCVHEFGGGADDNFFYQILIAR